MTIRDYDYENINVIYNPENCQDEIKCKNYELCNTTLPKWWFECKECYLCTNCDMMFGTRGKGILEFNDIECSICFENKRGVSQPNCDHYTCIDCFKRCYYLYNDDDGKPEFPYPEIEEEYYNDQENIKWKEYPLIDVYNEECDIWDDAKCERYEREEYLRCCPLCRK